MSEANWIGMHEDNPRGFHHMRNNSTKQTGIIGQIATPPPLLLESQPFHLSAIIQF